MPPEAERAPRADAARNVKRLLDAARAVFAEQGPDAPLEAIAERAGVGVRTLFRHFPHKEALVKTVLRQAITERLPPILYRTPDYEDPALALRSVMEAVLALIDLERNTLAAAANPGTMVTEVIAPVLEPLAALTERAQAAGALRDDVTGDDVTRVLAMLTNVLWAIPEGGGWHRYLVLVFDAFRPGSTTPLPPAEAEPLATRTRP
ncbi:TetR/AcrR family transcriptional regulator [Glycomyces paridis]|uniref:TetR family transcriptional regulator n=1 Tax=Glycomyces paridis TaxID=2126555 RepID=A0A4S8PLB0_9ACTN|nr:TetR/AcrR family transcriptional regulator [Glycomyces paridis]THV29044.1 TetR family transcriptional regulator [Glycomyces paridis]